MFFPETGIGEKIQPASYPLPSYLAIYLNQASPPIIPTCPPTISLQDIAPLSSESVTTRFVRAMRDFLHAPGTMEEYRVHPTDFTRHRYFTFPKTAIAILFERAKSAQTRILDLFLAGGFGSHAQSPTASAFWQARAKIQPEFFRDWAEFGTRFFYATYARDGFAPTWHGRYLWAVDCTILTLPDTPETRARFGFHGNQYPGKGAVQAQTSFLFDVLGELPVHVELGPQQAEKQFLLHGHARYLHANVISLYDRAYADFAVVAALTALPGDFVIRCPTSNTFKVVGDFASGDATDTIVTLAATGHQKALVSAHNLPREVTVRLVKANLPDGKKEVLITSLLDQGQYPAKDFQQLYDRRWGAETAFLRFKHQLEVECFSSGKLANIEQDFYSAVVLQTLEAVVDRMEDSVIRAISKCKHLTYEYKVKKASAYEWLSKHLVKLFLSSTKDLKHNLATYQKHLHLQTSAIRPGRHFPRPNLTPTQRLNFQLYHKKRR